VIVVEFLIFVVSSGLFCSANFRHRLWAVLIAGAIASGLSLLFVYDLYEKLTAHPQAPVKVVKLVRVPVVQHVSRPPSLTKPENCRDDYPFFARVFDREGTTELAFTVLADGTVSNVRVAKSSGFDSLDDAAVDCVSEWHYRPAIKDNQLVDAPINVKVNWNLHDDNSVANDSLSKKKDDAD
jgi:protein TonB